MKMHMKNPLWVTNPHVAKREFERELREIIDAIRIDYEGVFSRLEVVKMFREVLGE